MIGFAEIYSKAIALFDDPKITLAYQTNEIIFNKMMYSFLQNSISQFNNPIIIGQKLSDYTEPFGEMEIFEADGISKEFNVEMNIIENSLLQYVENGSFVKGKYDKDTKIVSFVNFLELGQEYSLEYYFSGCFNDDLKNISSEINSEKLIINQIKDILARLLIKSWAENTRNFLLDIKLLLTDTDFKLHPASPLLKSKNEWIKQLDSEILQMQNKLSFIIRFSKNSTWTRR
jgi:hypothetical protein